MKNQKPIFYVNVIEIFCFLYHVRCSKQIMLKRETS